MSELNFIIPDWKVPKAIKAFVTTRVGGVSESQFESLNLAQHVGDAATAVISNRKKLALAENSVTQWQWLKQVHGTGVAEADLVSGEIEADAWVCAQPNIACCVLTADCLPVFIAEKEGIEIGIVHAGWRGLSEGVIEATVVKMAAQPKNLIAWFGPAIGACHFEVGADVKAAFLNKVSDSTNRNLVEKCFLQTDTKNKYMADIYSLAKIRLNNLGIVEVSGGQHCTFCDVNSFYSHRRDGNSGRMASVIYMEMSDE
jgi:YfiH family protein